jgi:hypothetical protein
MQLVFATEGKCCDLAVHPVSEATARKVRRLGSGIYKQKYLNWWRKGNTCAYGMRLDADLCVRVALDGAPAAGGGQDLPRGRMDVTPPRHLGAKVNYLCVMGYDNERCGCSWVWNGVADYDPAGFSYETRRLDQAMGTADYLVLEAVLYQGRPADDVRWHGSKGFELIVPRVIALDRPAHGRAVGL